jgi:hypothetical protein
LAKLGRNAPAFENPLTVKQLLGRELDQDPQVSYAHFDFQIALSQTDEISIALVTVQKVTRGFHMTPLSGYDGNGTLNY